MHLTLELVLVSIAVLGCAAREGYVTVDTLSGKLEGNYTYTRHNRQVLQFLGVPYAEPPVNNLRLKAPEPIKKWPGVRQATTECDKCVQQFVLIEAIRDLVTGSEDCLCLNIFTPMVSTKAKMPVFFFIHGSAYIGLSSEKKQYGPELLLDKDVVLVAINYRFGPMGLMSTEDDVIPGNFAFKDQALALRWVKDNIRNFGGDPDSITLMGESSGAASVHLHMMSPLSKDLFKQGIIESGSAHCPWAVAEPGELKKRTAKLAELVGCPFTPSTALLSCLQALPAEKIVATNKEFLVWDIDPVVVWKATVEKPTVKNPFLTCSPWEQTSTKPLLAGFNYAEGGFKTLSVTSGDVPGKFKQWNDEFDKLMPISLLYDNTAPNPAAVTCAIRNFYFGPNKEPITPSMVTQIDWVYGDAWFIQGMLNSVERHRGPTYLYYFAYNSTVSRCPILYNNPINLGACHMDELMYLFPLDGSTPPVQPGNPDYEMSVKMVDLWTSFAKSSVPSTPGITWTPVQTKAHEHLEITKTGISMKANPVADRRAFWKTLKLRK